MASKSKKAQVADRRARIEQMRRAEQARERRNKILTIAAVTTVLVALTGGGWYLLNTAEEAEKAAAAPIEGVRTWEDLGREHVQTKVDYPMTPPAGGDHNQAWANCDAEVYTEPVPNENAVHSLEHGAVWITYNDKASSSDVEALTEKVSNTSYTFISPYEEQSSPITLTAWGHQLTVDEASDARIERFLDRYVQGEQTPEPGAACTGGVGA